MGFSLSGGPYQYNRFEVLSEKAKPDFLDMDKDGDKKESMKKAIKDKGCGCEKEPCECKKEDFNDWAHRLIEEGYDLSDWTWDGLHKTYLEIIESKSYVPGAKVDVKVKKGPALKEEIIQYLMKEGYANNPVSAEIICNNMSEEWLESLTVNY